MNKKQFANLHATLKSSFEAVRDDITKLKKRDLVIRDEVAALKKQMPNTITRDEFFDYVKKLDAQIDKSVDRDLLVSTEDKITKEMQELHKKDEAEITGLKDRLDSNHNDFNSRLGSLQKEIDKRFDALYSEMKKTEDLKKEVKEVKSFKKQLADVEKSFAKKKALDECFKEQDEIYDLLEDLESKALKKKDLESYQKQVDEKLKKFRDQMYEVDLVADKLNKRLKDLDDYERDIKKLSGSVNNLSSQINKVDASGKVKTLALQLKENRNVLNAFEKKLNEIVEATNQDRESEIAGMVADSFYKEEDIEDIRVEEPSRPHTQPAVLTSAKSSRKYEKPAPGPVSAEKPSTEEPGEKSKGFFGRIADWFFEEVPEEEEAAEEKEKKASEPKGEAKRESNSEARPSKKETKAEKKSEKKPEKKDIEKKGKKNQGSEREIKIDVSEKTSEGESKKGFFGRIVDWFLEEEPEEEESKETEKKAENKNKEEKPKKK